MALKSYHIHQLMQHDASFSPIFRLLPNTLPYFHDWQQVLLKWVRGNLRIPVGMQPGTISRSHCHDHRGFQLAQSLDRGCESRPTALVCRFSWVFNKQEIRRWGCQVHHLARNQQTQIDDYLSSCLVYSSCYVAYLTFGICLWTRLGSICTLLRNVHNFGRHWENQCSKINCCISTSRTCQERRRQPISYKESVSQS